VLQYGAFASTQSTFEEQLPVPVTQDPFWQTWPEAHWPFCVHSWQTPELVSQYDFGAEQSVLLAQWWAG
jgi:hypothetical protein